MLEQEFKALISKEQFEKIRYNYTWDKKFTQVNHYYFDNNDYIIKNEITVRVREKDNLYKLQIKIPESIRSNIHIKNEFSMPFDNVPQVISGDVLKKLCGFDVGDVKRLGELKTERRTKKISDSVKLFLDKNEYLNTIDFEVEIEYLNDESEIINLVRELGLSKSAVTYGKKTRFVQKLISG